MKEETKTNSVENLTTNMFFRVEEFTLYKDETRYFMNIPRPYNAIAVMLEGEAELEKENGSVVHIKAGDVFFVPMGSKYFSKWKADVNRKIVLFFSFETLKFKFKHKYSVQKIEGVNTTEVINLLSKILDNANQEFSFFKALSIFGDICLKILPLLKHDEQNIISIEIAKAVNYMEEHCDDSYNVKELLRLILMSESRFYIRFKEEIGETPIMYMNRLKINKAINLILQDVKSVEELASRTGFNSSVYFRRVFNKITGYTPSYFIKHKKKYYI